MLIEALKVLVVIFISSSILHGLVAWSGRKFDETVPSSDRCKAMLFGFHTRKSIEKYILPKFKKPALFFLLVRNISFLLLISVSLIEYFLR